jgi:hypothetical protein
VRAKAKIKIRGFAWDGGSGIRRVEISTDGGQTWRDAKLDRDFGRFAFRGFGFRFAPPAAGKYQLLAKATNFRGQTQADKLIFNTAGYHDNVARPVTINVV